MKGQGTGREFEVATRTTNPIRVRWLGPNFTGVVGHELWSKLFKRYSLVLSSLAFLIHFFEVLATLRGFQVEIVHFLRTFNYFL